MTPVVEVSDVRRRFGEVEALRGIGLTVAHGEILGVLGPNGAGKTTLVNVLTTLVRPDSGTARVLGHDVVREAAAVRASIGVTGQFAALDDGLTARENLVLFGRLLRRGRSEARESAGRLLDRCGLTEAADRRVGGFSGGMRRRLDLAASLLGDPEVLFLDEPTTGLDPRSRTWLWETVQELNAGGLTVVLTTQYLEEADRLADRIVVVDRGEVVAEGTASALKDRVGGAVCHVALDEPDVATACAALDPDHAVVVTQDGLSVTLAEGIDRVEALVAVARRLRAAGIAVQEIGLRRPSLDEAFLALTGDR